MPLILNIETSTNVCSVALAENDSIIFFHESAGENDHSAVLSVFIEEIFKKEKIKAADLDAIAVSKGPGSYTGLRIGVSVAKGLCYGANKPLIGISTLQAMASGIRAHPEIKKLSEEQKKSAWLCPMIDARRMEVYAAFFDMKNEQKKNVSADIITKDSYTDIISERTVIFFGNGCDKCKNFLIHKNALFIPAIHPSAADMIPLSMEAFHQDRFENIAYFEPFYLKDFIATIPKKKVINL
ncbi:MAG: tRNA (adenosine(37)-N6)-threonylcarbamoyltransferase complex dimerization subunit type 1 TsaB [Bacteroidia bacterium]|nr:tRNA (adenosine(37)-N6)-threonylcarbamoyltransferase complex dimerization subunit type 1 TsaB [Bacteroidia bacterium]